MKPSLTTVAAVTGLILACSLLPFLREIYGVLRTAPTVVADLLDGVPTILLLAALLLGACVAATVFGRRS